MQTENKLTKNFIIGTFVTLYVMVSIISTIHVIDFFELSNPKWLAVTLAVAFEVGAAASLASIIALKKMNKGIVWALFILLTLMQAMGNTYYAFVNLKGFEGWIELFGLIDQDPVQQKRIVAFISGAVLPLVALGFIKSLVDYIRPEDVTTVAVNDQITDSVTQTQITDAVTQSNLNDEAKKVWEKVDELREEGKLPEITEEDLTEEPTALAFTPNEHLEEDVNEEVLEEDQVVSYERIRDEKHVDELKRYIKSVIEQHENEEADEPTLETENIIEGTTDNSIDENYPVYDKSEDVVKPNALENIMVFTKNGNQ